MSYIPFGIAICLVIVVFLMVGIPANPGMFFVAAAVVVATAVIARICRNRGNEATAEYCRFAAQAARRAEDRERGAPQ